MNLELTIEKVRPLTIGERTCHFDGETYIILLDHERLSLQLDNVKTFMEDGYWHTLKQISQAVHASEASVSARLRDLRKQRFGFHRIDRQRTTPDGALFIYRLVSPDEPPKLTTALWNLAKKYGIECHQHEGELVFG